MSSIQAVQVSVQSRARELMHSLPQGADAGGRIRAAEEAVDRVAAEFPQTPEASAMHLVKSLAEATKRGVTRETLLNAGLELASRGAAAGSPYLAATALELSAMGWDQEDKDTLVAAGYRHLRSQRELPQPETLLKLAEKHGVLEHRRNLLEDAARGSGDLLETAALMVNTRTGGVEGSWFKLSEGTLAYLVDHAPEEVRPGYRMAEKMIGSWFRKVDGHAEARVLRAFMESPLKSPGEFGARAAEAVGGGDEDRDLRTVGQRAMDFLAPTGTPADRVFMDLARKAAEARAAGDSRDGARAAQKVLAAGLEWFGRHVEVSGPVLAGFGHSVEEAASQDLRGAGFLVGRCGDLAEHAPDGRWKAAFRDLARLLPHLDDSYYSSEPLQAFQKATERMAALGSGGDPVEAVVQGVSSVARGGDPASVLSDFLAGKDTGSLQNTGLVREILAVLAEDGATPQMRGTARFIHRAMESGDLKSGFQSMRDAFEIQELARAGAENPNAIRFDDESVTIGGVEIRRKAEGAAG